VKDTGLTIREMINMESLETISTDRESQQTPPTLSKSQVRAIGENLFRSVDTEGRGYVSKQQM